MESLRLDRPVLIRQYLDWRYAYEVDRGNNVADLQRDIDLIRGGVNVPPALRAELQISAGEATTDSPLSHSHPHEDIADAYLQLLLDGNRRDAHALIERELESGLSIEDLYLHVFQMVLYKVGDRWQRNQLSVGQEHFCTAAVQAAMSQMYTRIFASPRNGRKLVATSIAGNLHEVGIRMVADMLEMDGWDTHYLGADCPNQDVVQTIGSTGAEVLAVSATLVSQIHELTDLIGQIKTSFGDDYPILVGGRLFNSDPELWQRCRASAYAQDAKSAVDAANELVGAASG